MTMVAKASALVLGACLYLAEEFMLGYLAATTVPKAYFALFGSHEVVALVLEEATVMACPAFLLALVWGLAMTRRVRLAPRQVAGWAIAGLVVAWAARTLQVARVGSGGDATFADLASWLVPPVWGVLTSVSAPLGVLGAGLVAQRSAARGRFAAVH